MDDTNELANMADYQDRENTDLKPWRPSGLLTRTRTVGEVGLRKNGGFLDIWFRESGMTRWIAVRAADVRTFLESQDERCVLWAESDGNAEPEKRAGLDELNDRLRRYHEARSMQPFVPIREGQLTKEQIEMMLALEPE